MVPGPQAAVCWRVPSSKGLAAVMSTPSRPPDADGVHQRQPDLRNPLNSLDKKVELRPRANNVLRPLVRGAFAILRAGLLLVLARRRRAEATRAAETIAPRGGPPFRADPPFAISVRNTVVLARLSRAEERVNLTMLDGRSRRDGSPW
jgi:hypothetical protein